jgi:Tfp pilus assembly protein PilF
VDTSSKHIEDMHSLPGFISSKWYGMLVFLVAFAVYANTLGHGFVLDDLAVITHNKYVQQGTGGIAAIWTTPSLSGFADRQVAAGTAVNDLYRPVSLTLFAIEHQLFGSGAFVGHLFSVLLFACCALLFYRLLLRLLGNSRSYIALLAALLFAVHPIHTEVVANIKSRDELLCCCFAFSALLAALRYADTGRLALLIAAAFTYLISLLSKETSVSFVLLLPLVCFLFAAADRRRILLLGAVSVGVLCVYLFLRYSILSAHNANHPEMIEFLENPLTAVPQGASAVATAIQVMGRYLLWLLVPYPLSSDRTFDSIPFSGWGDVPVWLAVLAYLLLLVVAIRRYSKDRKDLIATGILVFLATIAVFTNLFFLTGAVMADRFLFLPSAGFCIEVAGIISLLQQRGVSVKGVTYVFLPVLLLLGGMAIARNADWKDNYSLATADLRHYPRNARLQHTVGYLLATERLQQADSDNEANGLLNEALQHYRSSLAIYAVQSKVHTDMADLFMRRQQYDSAQLHVAQALLLKPDDPVILSMLGGIYFAQARYDKTLELCRRALQRDPGNVAIRNNMGICFLQLKQYDSVIAISNQVLQSDPANTLAAGNLATAQQQLAQQH